VLGGLHLQYLGPPGLSDTVNEKIPMAAVAEKLTVEQFRATYSECKPYYELLDGEAVQKAKPAWPHSCLQGLLLTLSKDLGFKPRPELTLAISETWEPTPDVCGLLGLDDKQPYPTRPVPVVIEILSPDDRFTRVIRKCRKYAEWGVPDILVFDPVDHEAWYWDTATDNLAPVKQSTPSKVGMLS
jgi:Uma2 family endonuclease